MAEGKPAGKSVRFASSTAYRRYQVRVAREAILPVLGRMNVSLAGRAVLDLGCGHGGMSEVLRDEGARVVGLDRDAARLSGEEGSFTAGDAEVLPFASGVFDVVIAHDVIEHMPGYEAALSEVERVLSPGGRALVTFPPFFSPFGGHQQGLGIPWRFFAYGHMLPRPLWLSMAGSPEYRRLFDGLARMTISAFERAVSRTGLDVLERLFYLVRPEVALRMGLRPLEAPLLAGLGVLREFLTGAVFYLLAKPSLAR